jgi:hypothetical protein
MLYDSSVTVAPLDAREWMDHGSITTSVPVCDYHS